MPPKKPSPATKTTPKTTTQKPAAAVGRGTAAKPGAKKPSTAAVKPGASGTKGTTAKKGSTSPSKTQAKGKENAASPQVCVTVKLPTRLVSMVTGLMTV